MNRPATTRSALSRRLPSRRLPSLPLAPGPMPAGTAWPSVGRCAVTTAAMLARGRLWQPAENVGRVVRFADGSSSRVYRETRVDRAVPTDPCVLLVTFRLRWARGRGHELFEAESVLHTPLFAGFPGLVSKLWLAHDEQQRYRGLYEWDGPSLADGYARSLWRVLELASEPGSIDFRVLSGLRRDDLLDHPDRSVGAAPPDPDPWWRVTATEPAPPPPPRLSLVRDVSRRAGRGC